MKIKDGFSGELQINVPRKVVVNQLIKQDFLNNLFITHLGFFPKAKFHYRERQFGCVDNILIYCTGGKGYYQTDSDNYELKANQFMILPPGKFHVYQADLRDPWTIYWIHFSGSKLKHFNRWMQTENYIQPTNISFDKRIVEHWTNMYCTLQGGFTENNLANANLSLYQFLTFFLCPTTLTNSVPQKNLIAESIAFMKANIDKILSVEQLAAHLNYSRSHFTALFRDNTGTSPIEYFIQLKIQYACQLLQQSDLKINEISSKLGYDDSFYFSRLFKKVTKKAPKDYRKTTQQQTFHSNT